MRADITHDLDTWIDLGMEFLLQLLESVGCKRKAKQACLMESLQRGQHGHIYHKEGCALSHCSSPP